VNLEKILKEKPFPSFSGTGLDYQAFGQKPGAI